MLVVGNEREWPYGEFQGQGTNSCNCLNKYLNEWNFGVQVEKVIPPFLRQH